MSELTDRQVQCLLRDYLKRVLEMDDHRRVIGRKDRPEGEVLDTHTDGMAYVRDDCYRELAIGNHSRAKGAVNRLLEEKGITLDRDGVHYNKLCRAMMKAMINHLEIDMRRSRRDYSLEDLPFPEFSPSPR